MHRPELMFYLPWLMSHMRCISYISIWEVYLPFAFDFECHGLHHRVTTAFFWQFSETLFGTLCCTMVHHQATIWVLSTDHAKLSWWQPRPRSAWFVWLSKSKLGSDLLPGACAKTSLRLPGVTRHKPAVYWPSPQAKYYCLCLDLAFSWNPRLASM